MTWWLIRNPDLQFESGEPEYPFAEIEGKNIFRGHINQGWFLTMAISTNDRGLGIANGLGDMAVIMIAAMWPVVLAPT
ncbi:MAG TPA: hypothetical protein VKR32_15065 [Puia sp.]|nr:hypothetical protein [Puia sp.]